MIFVTIGTQLPFDRFIKIIDEMAPVIGEEIVAQVNKCNFEPKHIKTVSFLPPDEFNQLFGKARLIVSHAGMGTILSAMQQGKPIIIFPRIAALGEHRNEHQLATARKFKELGTVYVAMNDEELKMLLLRKDLSCLKTIGDTASSALINSIKEYIVRTEK
jgi:UDP-N-acetylglucosamine transferase subunit ALG13